MKKIIFILMSILYAASASASINVISGSLSYRQEVFAVNGGPMSLRFMLSYNSFNHQDGPLGPGWEHNYNSYLHENTDGTMVFTGGGKKRFYFPIETTTGNGKNKIVSISYVSRVGDFSSLEKNADDTWTLSLRSGLTYQFGTDYKLGSMTDRYGNTITVDHTVADQMTITDASGRSLVIYYDAETKISSISDPAQKTYNFNYHPDSGLLWTVSYPAPDAGATQPVYEFLYTPEDLFEYRVDPEGHITKYGYDTKGRVIRTVDPDGVLDTSGGEIPTGHTKTFEYDVPDIAQTTVTEKDGGSWIYSFDQAEGLLTSKREPDGDVISYTYYPSGHDYYGLRHEKIEPVDVDTVYVTTYLAYDSFGNLLEKTGHARHYTTSKNGRITETDDSVDMHLAYTYDNDNGDRLTSNSDLILEPASVTSFVYDTDTEGFERLSVTDPANKQIIYRLNGNGSSKDISGPYGTLLSNQYNANGNLLSTTNAAGVRTEFLNYDAMGNPGVVKVIGIDGSVQEALLGYDALNRLKTITKQGIVLDISATPVDLLTQFGYDKLGNRISVVDAEQNSTAYDYNYKGQVTTITDAYLEKTELIYSGAGCGSCGSGVNKLTGLIDANHSGGDPTTAPKTTFTYYPDGNIKSEADPLGNRIIYTYYPGGLLKDKRLDADDDGEPSESDPMLLHFTYYPDGKIQSKYDDIAGQVMDFTYWPEGWLKTANGPHIGYTFEYYPNGWLKKVTDTNGRVINYNAYDDLGQRDQVTLLPGTADQKILDYGYDGNGRLQAIASSAGTFTFDYDAFGRRESLAYPNGIVGTYAYHPKTNWLTGITYANGMATPAADVQYPAHDKVGNRKERKENDVTTSYDYDDLYRLLTASSLEATESFTFDPVGNRQSGPTAQDTELSAYDYDDANRMLLGRMDTYEYDAFGNKRFRYLAADPNHFWQYTWDGDNRLVKAELNNTGNVLRTVTFKYDPFGRRIEKNVVEAASSITHTYVYSGEDIVLEYVNNGAGTTLTHYIHGPGIDEPMAMVRGGQNYFYHADGLGSIVAITDASSNVVQKYAYESFGALVSQNPSFENAYTYTGREWDKEIDLYYYRARFYDPIDGRFISSDPIGFAGGDVNLYGYVQNNPINWIDPLGLAGCYVGYPRYPITIPGTSTKVPLTHAGVLSYDSQGHTRYYEYGRYDSNLGNVRRRTVPDLQMGPDGKPTPESWAKLLDALNNIGNGTTAKASCDDKADADKINNFAEQRMNDPNRAPHSWNPFNFNTCTTFASDALEAGLK